MGELADDLKFAAKCRSDFEFFARNVLDQSQFDGGELVLKDFHKDWIQALEDNDRLAITAFTGSGKTTLIGVCYPLWKVFTEPGWDALIVSNAMGQSTRLLGEIKAHIENSEYLQHLKDASENTWSKTEIELTNGSRIYCKPYNPNVKGVHVDFVLCDEAAEFSPHDIFHRYVKTRATRKDGTIALISTPVHENDLMQKLSDGHELGSCPECNERLHKNTVEAENGMERTEYYCDEHGIVEEPEYNENVSEKGYWNGTFPIRDPDTEKPHFPEAFDQDSIAQLHRENPTAFQREYMCEAVAIEGDLFDPNDVVDCYHADYTFKQKANEESKYYLGCDFAVSKQGDYSVFTVLEDHPDIDGVLIRYMERLRGLNLPEQEDRIEDLHSVFDFESIIVDSSNFGRSTLRNLLDRGLPVEGQSFERKSRNNLIINLKTMLENNDIIIPRNDEFQMTISLTDVLYNELLGFGTAETQSGAVTYKSTAKHDDTVMSLGMAANAIEDNRDLHMTIAFA